MKASEPIEPWEDLEAQQIALERAAVERAAPAGDDARRSADDAVARRHLAELEAAVTRWSDAAATLNPTRRPRAAELLAQLDDPAAAALVTLQRLLVAAAQTSPLTRVAVMIGARLEDELRLRRLRRSERRMFNHLERRARRLSAYRARRAVFMRAAARLQDKALWTARDKLLLGVKLTELAIEATGLFEAPLSQDPLSSRSKTRRVLQATPALTEQLRQSALRAALLKVEREPMVAPPAAWNGVWGGGYLTAQAPPLSLVKTRSKAHLSELEAMRAPTVFAAINAAQATPWRINRRLLALAERCFEEGSGLGGLPSLIAAAPPQGTQEQETQEQGAPGAGTERTVSARRATRLWREEERRRRSRAVAFGLALQTARRFSRFERLWLPHQFDFRGRLYPVTQLSPQSADPVRALLEFADGEPLGAEGWKWLAIHLANCGDFEKISKAPLADRVRWVFRYEERIRAAAADPLADLFWTEADKPWQFLAACFEWSDYVDWIEREGEASANQGFRSHLPVALDGACSGLQHFSLMLRDEVGGAAVNLAPKASSADLYTEVAERVRGLLQAELEQNDEERAAARAGGPVRELARAWLEFGVTRELVKRPTMTYGYGARGFGYAVQILEDALAPRRALAAAGRAAWPFADEDPAPPAIYLAGVVEQAIEGVVVKAAEAMAWLQSLADVAARHDRPVRWTTPDGFVAAQAYRATRARLVHTALCGKTLRLTLREEVDALDRRRQRQGIAPNVIHSLDACHLRLTVAQAVEEGIRSFALVHDSFATHAAGSPRFFQIIREAVVALYAEEDVPARLRREIGATLPSHARAALPPPPPRGALALEGVLEAEFAFA